MSSRRCPMLAAAVSSALAMMCCGCQTTVTTADGGPPAPKPREGSVTPKSARPNALAVTFAPKPADSDGNMRPDTLQVTVYLFSRPHPSPVHADGAFGFAIFELGEAGNPERPGGTPLREWRFDADAVQRARSRALAGPCHELSLSLLANGGTDDLPVESVDLVAWFEPADGGDRVWLRGVRSVQFPRPSR